MSQLTAIIKAFHRVSGKTELEQWFSGAVKRLSLTLDKIAGFCLVLIMILVVSNIILRTVFSHPILGAYEYAGLLTSIVIALGVANCAVNNAHIAVDFIIERLPGKTKSFFDSFINFTAVLFWGVTAWHVGKYAQSTAAKNVVSSTAQVPLYPFIYVIALGLFVLCLVLMVKLIESIKKVTT